jgi:Ca-activated chloride channel family protein
MTIRFLQPDMTAWLSVVPAVVALWAVHFLYKYRARRRTAVQHRFRSLSRRSTWHGDAFRLLLAVMATGLLGLALMRPQVLMERRTPEFERQDLILILDRSVSMKARDVRPSRAERALTEIKNFLRRKPEAIDRVGLVGFAGTSLVLSYLTTDVGSILFYLDWIADDPAVMYGTDMGAALTSAMEVVRRDEQPTRKLFLVISDGEDQGTTMAQAVTAARAQRIRVHAIGIGSAQESMIPVSFPGQRETFLTDDAGRLLKTRFNETSLRTLAAATGGQYLRSATGGELRAALEEIAGADRVQTGWRTTTEYRDLYLSLLAAAGVAAAALVALL